MMSLSMMMMKESRAKPRMRLMLASGDSIIESDHSRASNRHHV